MFVRFQPCLALIVRHGKHAIVSFVAIMYHWPCNCSAQKNERETRDLRCATALNKGDDERDDAHRQSVDRQRVDQDMNVFRLTKILAK